MKKYIVGLIVLVSIIVLAVLIIPSKEEKKEIKIR